MSRKLISSKEEKISIIQFIGFLLILAGIGVIICAVYNSNDPSRIAIAFFITMLGFAFAFPSLLEGNDGLSTMRIVVFMVVNVICLLLIKIGWGKASLEEIGLDQWWMGVIAFVFGAKATQSYFESQMAVPKEVPTRKGVAALDFSNADIAKLAVVQNEQYLKVKFPCIVSISDAVHDLKNADSHVVTIYLKDNNSIGIPDRLEVKMPDGSIKTIGTEIVKNVGVGRIHVNQQSVVDTGQSKGSICCIVNTNNGFNAIVTAGHVYSNSRNDNYGGALEAAKQSRVDIDGKTGKWIYQLINSKNDIALAHFDEAVDYDGYVSFKGKTHYKVSDADVKKTKVNLVSHIKGERLGYILDYKTCWDLEYLNAIDSKNNIIVIGSSPDRDNSKTVSQEGDSGGCVYEPITGNLIGIILGGNDSYTWVLPIEDVLKQNNYTLI